MIENLLVTYFGHLGSDASREQTWSMGIRFEGVTPGEFNALAPSAAQDLADQMVTDFVANMPASMFADTVWLYGAKIAAIAEDGHYGSLPYTGVHSIGEPYGSASYRMPFQDALVVTFRHVALGTGNYGRVYLPPVGAEPTLGGLIDTGTRDSYLANAVSWLTDTQASVVDVFPEALLSIIGRGEIPTSKSVQQVGIGLVIDTQRRRRDKLVESIAYTSL